MTKILDGLCSNAPILEGIDVWPRPASKTEWFRITRELIQSVIADMDLDPDSLSQVEEAFKILQTGVVDQQQREAVDQVRTQL